MNKSGKPYKLSYILLFFTCILPIQIYLYRTESFFNFLFIEYYIDNYSKVSQLRLNPLSYFSFSLGDYIYMVLSIIIIFYYWKNRIFYLTYKKAFLFEIFSFISMIILFFQISWGVNYSKEGLASKWNVKKN